MTISVTTRGGKGSALTQSEMDTNLTNLARDASTTQQGNTRYATQAEVDAGSAVSAAVTPDKLAALINLSDATIGPAGFITLQNGLIIQWGPEESVGAGASKSVTFPTPFPTQAFHVGITETRPSDRELTLSLQSTASTTGFTVPNGGSGFTKYFWWFAIGN